MPEQRDSTVVSYRKEGPVATVTMDDGKVNALTFPLIAALNEALDQALEDHAVVMLAGRQGRFSAGFDLKTLTGGGGEGPALLTAGFELSERLLSYPYPVVIACTGHALAMGSFLLLSGDYRVGADGDFKIGANEVAIGLVMPETAIEICKQRIPASHFGRVVVNAEIFEPSEAVSAGFLDRVVPAASVTEVASETAARMATLDMRAHTATKLRVRAGTLAAMRATIVSDEAAFVEMLTA
jgi:enoyl-CoA hydratase